MESIVASLKPLADFSKLTIEVVDWRTAVPDMGRPQQVIFDQLQPATWDVFVGILWHRFGTPSGGRNLLTHQTYLSGTEEEFHTAYSLWKRFKRPRIMLYRCLRQVSLDALDLDQYARVKSFFGELDAVQGHFPGLYQSFETTEGFERLMLHNLQQVIIECKDPIRPAPTTDSQNKPAPPDLVSPPTLPQEGPSPGKARLPEMDVYETQDEYIVEFTLPGSKANDFEILLEGSTLTVMGKLRPLLPKAKYVYQERLHGPFARSVTIPSLPSCGAPKAHYLNGVLTVVFPKRVKTPPIT